MNSLAKAFESAGYKREDMAFYSAVMIYLRAGGTVETGAEILARAAKKLRSDGHHVLGNPIADASASQPHRGGEGQKEGATQNAVAHPVREPSPAERSAASSIAKTVAITVLDTVKVRDGRAIGDIRYGELERLRGENAMEASLIRQIQRHATAPHDARVRDIVKVADLQKMIQRASEVADAA